MKIRNGYVSNSSSSSFLVIYNTKEDFIKFKDFHGYDIFMKDLEKVDDNFVKGYILGLLESNYYRMYMQYIHKKNIDRDIEEVFAIDCLSEISGVSLDDYWKMIGETNHIGGKFWEENQDILDDYNNPKIQEYEYRYYENEDNKILIKRIANDLFNAIKNKNLSVVAIRYEDDTDDGEYMETGFMPFLMHNPEKEYFITSRNEH